MLVLTTKIGQSIALTGADGEQLATFYVKKIKGSSTMQVAIDAPESTRVTRSNARVRVKTLNPSVHQPPVEV